MTLSVPLFLTVAAIAPIIGLIFIGRIRAGRRRAALVDAGAPRPSAEYLFEPKAERTPSLFLRRFTLPQRTYLSRQFTTARIFLVLYTYILFVVASVALLPGQIHVAMAGHAQGVWERYQDQLTVAGYVAEVFSFPTAMVLVTVLKTPVYANFNRTRPLSFRFLFWGPACMALASLLAATQAALLASLLILRLTYGPVWNLAPNSSRSVFQLDLSMLTTTSLIFSIFVFLSFLPGRLSMTGAWKFIPIFLGVMVGSQAVRSTHFLLTTSAGKILFLFPAQAPPQHEAYALVPLGCVMALLLLAEHLSARLEI